MHFAVCNTLLDRLLGSIEEPPHRQPPRDTCCKPVQTGVSLAMSRVDTISGSNLRPLGLASIEPDHNSTLIDVGKWLSDPRLTARLAVASCGQPVTRVEHNGLHTCVHCGHMHTHSHTRRRARCSPFEPLQVTHSVPFRNSKPVDCVTRRTSMYAVLVPLDTVY